MININEFNSMKKLNKRLKLLATRQTLMVFDRPYTLLKAETLVEELGFDARTVSDEMLENPEEYSKYKSGLTVAVLPDLKNNSNELLTDGCGECSVDLFAKYKLMYDAVSKLSVTHHGIHQIRALGPFGVVKGCLVTNPFLPPQTIVLRRSMIKARAAKRIKKIFIGNPCRYEKNYRM